MKKYINSLTFLIICIFAPFLSCAGGGENDAQISDESEAAADLYSIAVQKVNDNEGSGFLILYEMANDDVKYTVEYSEVAQESLQEYLFKYPELWVRTFSKIDQNKFRKFFYSIGYSELPAGIKNDKEYIYILEERIKKLKFIEKKEIDLQNYIINLCKEQREWSETIKNN